MRKETYAGIKAGALVSVLVSLIPVALLFGFSLLVPPSDLANRPSFVPFVVIGAIGVLLVSLVIGAILGFIYAVWVDKKLPLHSTYAKSLAFALILWIIFGVGFPLATYPLSGYLSPSPFILDIGSVLIVLVWFVIEGLCFAYAYSKLTRDNQPKSNSQNA